MISQTEVSSNHQFGGCGTVYLQLANLVLVSSPKKLAFLKWCVKFHQGLCDTSAPLSLFLVAKTAW